MINILKNMWLHIYIYIKNEFDWKIHLYFIWLNTKNLIIHKINNK